MKIPFDCESVESELVGKSLVVSRSKWGSEKFALVGDVVLEKEGGAQGAEGWSVEDGET